MTARGEFAGNSAVASQRQGPPSEIDASLGSSLIYAFITVNNASPFTSGLSCHSFSHACLPTYLPDARLSRPVVHLAVIYSARAIPLRKALRSSESNAVSQMYFKTTRRSYLPLSGCLCAPCLPHSPAGLLVLTSINVEQNFIEYGAI